MNDTVDSILATLRTKHSALTPAMQVYMGSVPDTAAAPYSYIFSGDELEGAPYYGRMQDVVTLHHFGRSIREVGLMQNAAEFLDDYRAPTFGNAVGPHYQIQSKTAVEEADGIWHGVSTYTVDYQDKRKLPL